MKLQRPNCDPTWRWRIPRALGCTLLIVLFAFVSLVACRSKREDQGHPYSLSGPALAAFTALEPIDAHTHVSQTGPAFVGMLERLHMHVLDILYVDDTDPNHTSTEPQRQDAMKFIASSNGHAQLCTTFDPFQFNNPNFSKEAIRTLNQDFADGAVAAKVWKNIGMEIKDGSGQYVMPDDPRLEPIYKDIATHDKTLIIHTADPDAAWDAQYPTTGSKNYYATHPQWDMSRNPIAPRKQAILDARDHLLAMNPDLRVVGAHLGSMEKELNDLANHFERYPNFAVDTSARINRFTLQPRDKARDFILKYQDRILYGTDLHFESGITEQAAIRTWQNQYALDWRYLATDDTFDYQGNRVRGAQFTPLCAEEAVPRQCGALDSRHRHETALGSSPGAGVVPVGSRPLILRVKLLQFASVLKSPHTLWVVRSLRLEGDLVMKYGRKVPIVLVLILCVVFTAVPAYAYIDPNAAGLISQILTPLLIAGAAAATFLRKQIGAVFASLSRRLRGRPDV